jgi:hypothetical protein
MQWSDIPRNPSRTMLRQFSALWLLFFGGLAAWHGWMHGRVELALSLTLLALTIGPAGIIHPPLVRWLFVGWTMAVFPVGWMVSRVVLAGLFYGLFTPLALLFRLLGRDALGLKRQPEAATYWQTKPAVTDLKRYFQQF